MFEAAFGATLSIEDALILIGEIDEVVTQVEELVLKNGGSIEVTETSEEPNTPTLMSLADPGPIILGSFKPNNENIAETSLEQWLNSVRIPQDKLPSSGDECKRNRWYIEEEMVPGIGYRMAILHECQSKLLSIRFSGKKSPDWTRKILGGYDDDSEGIAGGASFNLE